MPRDATTVRFAGDAGDGVRLLGARLAAAAVRAGYAVATRFDPPAEIRSPPGTRPGVHAVQVRFGRSPALLPGDRADCLFALNPAALEIYSPHLGPGGSLIVNADSYTPDNLDAAGIIGDPLATVPESSVLFLTGLTREAVAGCKLSARDAGRCMHFFVLGLALGLCGLPADEAFRWSKERLSQNPPAADAAGRAIRAGAALAATLTLLERPPLATPPDGTVRLWNGLEAVALGLVAGADAAGRGLVLAGTPGIPAGGLLDILARPEFVRRGVRTVPDDDPAAVAIGAGYAGHLGVAVVGGPGLTDAAGVVGLASAAGVPLVVVHTPRATRGPGLPDPFAQPDLLAAVHGRAGDLPAIVLAPRSPADGFATASEAVRLTFEQRRPVVVLVDAVLAVSEESGAVPVVAGASVVAAGGGPWPGVAAGRHRTGVELRRPPELAPNVVPDLAVDGDTGGLLVVGFGATFGAIQGAVDQLRAAGVSAGHAHVHHLSPLPANTLGVLAAARRVAVVEGNGGQLLALLRGGMSADVIHLSSVTRADGGPFEADDLAARLLAEVGGRP